MEERIILTFLLVLYVTVPLAMFAIIGSIVYLMIGE